MKKPSTIPFSTSAVVTLAEIKAAIEAFNRGETNAFDTLDAIVVAIEAHQAAAQKVRKAA